MLVASTPCGSGYIHMYLLYYIATCAISTILDTDTLCPSITVSICMIFFVLYFLLLLSSASLSITFLVHRQYMWLQVFTQTRAPQCFTMMWHTVLYNGREFSVVSVWQSGKNIGSQPKFAGPLAVTIWPQRVTCVCIKFQTLSHLVTQKFQTLVINS